MDLGIPNLHPFVNHFIISLFPVSVLLDLLGYYTGNDKLRFAAWINLLLSGFALLISIITGLIAKEQVAITPAAENTFETHETLAFISAAIILSLLFWRIGYRGELPVKGKFLYLVISMAGVLIIFACALFGGQLVFRYQIGVGL